MKHFLIYILATFFFCMSCSSERLTILEPKKSGSFENFTAKVPQEVLQETQKLKSTGDYQEVKTAKGNSIYFTKDDFKPLKNGKRVEYPIDLEVIELMSIKDIILHKKPTVSQGRLLTTDGQIYVKAFKDGEELFLKEGSDFMLVMNGMNGKVDTEMELFLGSETNNGFEWTLDSLAIEVFEDEVPGIRGGQTRYLCYPRTLGWINIDKFADYDEVTTVFFETKDIDIKKVNIDLYFPEINSVMTNYRDRISGLPLGFKAFVIAYSVDKEDNWVADIQEIVISENMKVEITLKETTEKDLMEFLEKLGR